MDDDYKKKYLTLVEYVESVIESYDYMNLEHISTVSWKMSTCVHGNTPMDGCEQCICEFLSKAINYDRR